MPRKKKLQEVGGLRLVAYYRYSNCGAPLNVSSENFCTNPDCKRHKEHFSFAPGVRFCDQCGKLTTDGKKIEALI